MGSVDVFGRRNKSRDTNASVKVSSNGGIELNNDALSIKLNPDVRNTLSVSSRGLKSNAMKLTGGSLTGNINMNGNLITGLPHTLPPIDRTSAICYSQLERKLEKYWSLDKTNEVNSSAKFGTSNDCDVLLYRNDIRFMSFRTSSVNINKNLNIVMGKDMEKTFGILDIGPGKKVKIYLGDISNQINYSWGSPIQIFSSFGVKFSTPTGDICTFGSNTDDRVRFNKDVIMNNNSITNLRDPINAQDCTTKHYVDSLFSNPVSNFPVPDYSILISPTKLVTTNNMITIKDDGPLRLQFFGNCTKMFDIKRSLNYLKFNGLNEELICPCVPTSCFKNHCTLFFMTKVYEKKDQINFAWYDVDKNYRFSAHIPYKDGKVYVDHPVGNGRVITSDQTDTLGKVNLWSYRIDETYQVKIWLNGIETISSNLSNSMSFEKSQFGYLVLSSARGTSYCQQDIYNLVTYNRSLTDIEMRLMHDYFKTLMLNES